MVIASIGWNSDDMKRHETEDGRPSNEVISKRRGSSHAKDKFRNRSRLEIVSNLLTRARNGALKTHLMYGANLSYPMLGEYLNILLRSELILEERDENDVSIRYRTTQKGLEFLRLYESIKEMFGDQYLGLTGASKSSSDELFSKVPWDAVATETVPQVTVS